MPPPPPEPEDQGPQEPPSFKSEIEELQWKMNHKTDDSLEATRRMKALCEESKEAGINILVALDDQGEKLDKIEEDVDKINSDMKEAEKALSGMEACCGLCTLPWNKKKEFEEDPSAWKADNDGKVNNGQPMRVGEGPQMMGPMVHRITKDAREDEMDENLQGVTSMVGNLRNMAMDMNSEIGTQNETLGRINAKAGSNEGRIKAANERAAKLNQ